MNNEALKSKTGPGDSWGTPQDLFVEIAHKYLPGVGPIFDPCPNLARPLGGSYFHPDFNALKDDWGEYCGSANNRIFVNPPFSNISPFAKRCYEFAPNSYGGFQGKIAMLVPVRSDMLWWFNCVEHCLVRVIFIKGRVKYIDPVTRLPGKSPSFASAVLLFGGVPGVEAWEPECHKKVKHEKV